MAEDFSERLNILSVFLTVDGEANAFHVGTPSVFIRLTGCGVGCHYCDTKYSWSYKQGQWMSHHELMAAVSYVAKGGARKVTITGGEPLEQYGQAMAMAIWGLMDKGYDVSIETAGTRGEQMEQLRSLFTDRLCIVADWKLSSARAKRICRVASYVSLLPTDVVKFVVGSTTDLAEAAQVVRDMRDIHGVQARKVFSPMQGGELSPGSVFDYLKANSFFEGQVGMSMQMHKYIFPEGFRDEEADGQVFARFTKEL